jgi:uncharacterized membrane protein YkvA (DUF1232 family)
VVCQCQLGDSLVTEKRGVRVVFSIARNAVQCYLSRMRLTSVFKSWKQKAKTLKKEVCALSLAVKDPRVPWYAKAFAVLIIGYILSPIDPIPDFIPVIGYLDELVIVPLAIIILGKLIPKEVLEECREKAKHHRGRMKGKHWIAASIIILIWFTVVYLGIRIVYHFFS